MKELNNSETIVIMMFFITLAIISVLLINDFTGNKISSDDLCKIHTANCENYEQKKRLYESKWMPFPDENNKPEKNEISLKNIKQELEELNKKLGELKK